MMEANDVIVDYTDNNKVLGKTFYWMFLGLLGSGIIAAYTYYSGLFVTLIEGGGFIAVGIAELVIVLLFSFLFRKLSAAAVGVLYFVYSMVNGITLCTVFAYFELQSIITLFRVSALIFAVLGYIGYNTKKDLSSWSTYIMVFLIAGLVLSLINLFVYNSTFDLVVNWFILAVFLGVTIYDLNKVKLLQENPDFQSDKIHIYCAMQLYLDFINIFLRILYLFGDRRD